MELHNGLDELEKMKQELMAKLPSDKLKLVKESMLRMSKATSPEELAKIQNSELEKLKNVC